MSDPFREAKRRAATMAGAWRVQGTDPERPETWHVLVLTEVAAQRVFGMDTANRGILEAVRVQYVGALAGAGSGTTGHGFRGTLQRPDGSRSSVLTCVDPSGGRFRGWIQDAAGRRPYIGVRLSSRVDPGLADFLKRRDWRATDLSGVEWGKLRVPGVGAVDIPTGFSQKGPLGTEVRVDKKGVRVQGPDVDKVVKDAKDAIGIGEGASFPDKKRKGDKEAADESASGRGWIYGALAIVGTAVVLTLVAFVVRRRRE